MISPRVESPIATNKSQSPPSHSKFKLLVVFGTRPEAVKLAPLVSQLRRMDREMETVVCVTAQHRTLLDQALQVFGLVPDLDLDLMQEGQTLPSLTARIVGGLEPVFAAVQPQLTILQGDTSTAFCGALASFYAGVPIAHVEAGLRTFDRSSPFPEEMHRAMTSLLTALHFAPTAWAAENLLGAGVPAETIHITGNTGVDAILNIAERLETGKLAGIPLPIDDQRKLILVTAHRRESFGVPLEQICEAVVEIASRNDVQIVWPVHPNPHIQPVVQSKLAQQSNINLIGSLEYGAFVDLLRKAYFVITDSGGIQEEGPSLGKPILVLRDKTERPEAVTAGTVKLVGCDRKRIVTEAVRLLDDNVEYNRMSCIQNPYGDGKASERIAAHIRDFLSKQ